VVSTWRPQQLPNTGVCESSTVRASSICRVISGPPLYMLSDEPVIATPS
jgi:hypothetical protein